MSSSEESPFTISIPEDQLARLQQKLALTTFPDELEAAGWDYGVPLADVKRLVNRWKDGFDWRNHEAVLNAELPQFTRDLDIDGFGTLNIHYVHKKSELETAIPILFVHGWPGSFHEVRSILPILIKASPEHPSFHVVAISLPGFGFSTAPSKKGFGVAQYAEVSHKLMLALGYNEYVTQGGDWGHRITRKMAHLYGPKNVKAWHTNFPQGPSPALTSNPIHWLHEKLRFLPFLGYSERDKAGLARFAWFRRYGRGYYALQSTRPQTVGYALADSPAGLAAWLYEKLVEWTDKHPWDDDEVLTWISLYYFSRAGPTASMRIYYEAVQSAGGMDLFNQVEHTTVPLGYSYFPKETSFFPRTYIMRPNVVFEAYHESGGHFAAYEKPEALAGDLRKMFGRGGRAFNVVKGKNGYAE